MFYDDLPIWGFIGKLEKVSKPSGIEIRYFIFTHVHFEILWNLQHIVEINVSTDPNQVVDISEDVVGSSPDATVNAEFTYSAKWKESEITFDKRMDKYRRNQFLPQHLEVANLCLCLVFCAHMCPKLDDLSSFLSCMTFTFISSLPMDLRTTSIHMCCFACCFL